MGASPLTLDGFREATGVSRETLARLRIYEALLRKWQPSINLVGPATLGDPWRRHFLDSAQLSPLALSTGGTWVDVGSGAGFPGLVLAAMGLGHFHLVESDARKAAFLREAAREMGVDVAIHAQRLDRVSRETTGAVQGITARAFSSLSEVLVQTQHLAEEATCFLLLVGRDAPRALTDARKRWKMQADEFPSRSDPTSWVVRLQGVSRG
ncbi:MAG: 16S rRNA (guanine(527)-N(7))-methyltransferase RsmG [Alphaproteobacteria bacterium]|nr:16S rRNA (guanine(527)-N(7))-methyltransferase RsmG [Alphaproteobacteria bacterium]MBM4435895.1 16S rRNA (guanine(527)-N(7))-methyltransferase RsmG [Actinomycetota bacterium]